MSVNELQSYLLKYKKHLAMMIFVLLYFPCIATVAAIAQEAGGWRWALFSVVYNTLLAWVVAFAAFHIGTLLGL